MVSICLYIFQRCILSNLRRKNIILQQTLLLFHDGGSMQLNSVLPKLLASLTAVKIWISQRWKPAHKQHGGGELQCMQNAVLMELFTARSPKVKAYREYQMYFTDDTSSSRWLYCACRVWHTLVVCHRREKERVIWSIGKRTDWPPALLSVSLSADELSPELQKRGGGNQEETTHNHEREGGLWSVDGEDELGGFHTWSDIMSSGSSQREVRHDCSIQGQYLYE